MEMDLFLGLLPAIFCALGALTLVYAALFGADLSEKRLEEQKEAMRRTKAREKRAAEVLK